MTSDECRDLYVLSPSVDGRVGRTRKFRSMRMALVEAIYCPDEHILNTTYLRL